MVDRLSPGIVALDLVDKHYSSPGGGAGVVFGRVTYDTGEVKDGVIKIFKDVSRAGKERKILGRMEETNPELPLAKVFDYRMGDQVGFPPEAVVLFETKVEGPRLADEPLPRPLSQVQADGKTLFQELAAVSGDEELVREGVGYCGDISSLNVIRSSGGYSIIDWSGGQGDSSVIRVSPRYIPPEIIRKQDVLDVNADTFSLGSLFARALLGRDNFRAMFPDNGEGKETFLKFDLIKEIVPQSVLGFFKKVLAEDPLERVPEGVTNARDHYLALGRMFGSLE